MLYGHVGDKDYFVKSQLEDIQTNKQCENNFLHLFLGSCCDNKTKLVSLIMFLVNREVDETNLDEFVKC